MSLNWTNLVIKGRAKGQNEPWNPEELAAVYAIAKEQNLTIAEVAPYVRAGVLTVEDFKDAVETGKTPVTKTETTLEEASTEVTPNETPVMDDASETTFSSAKSTKKASVKAKHK